MRNNIENFNLVQKVWKSYTQQDLGGKRILKSQEFHKLCRKQWKRAILTHRDGAHNYVSYNTI